MQRSGFEVEWEAVSAISTALGAVASFAAVVTALWLARNSGKPKLAIEAVVGLKLQPSGPLDCVIVEVANTGARAETITSVWFRARGQKSRMLFEIAADEDADQLPKRVEPGEVARFLYRPLEFMRDIARSEEFTRFKFLLGRAYTRRIYVGAQTATNFFVTARVSPIVQILFDTKNPSAFLSFRLTEEHPVQPHIQKGVRGFYSTRNP